MIGVNNLTRFHLNESFFKKITKKILEKEKKKDRELSIVLIEPAGIKRINEKYRRKNRVTDVLTFNQSQKFLKKNFQIGEIIICPAEVKKNARRFNLPFKKELTKVLIHGILHLLGYNHEIKRVKTRKMEEKENYYLNSIFK